MLKRLSGLWPGKAAQELRAPLRQESSGGSGGDAPLLAALGLVPAPPVLGLSSLSLPQIEDALGSPSRYQTELLRETKDSSLNRTLFRRAAEEARAAAHRALHQQAAREGLAGLLNVLFSTHSRTLESGIPFVEVRATGQGLRWLPEVSERRRREPPFSATFGARDLTLLADHGLWPIQALIRSIVAPYLRTLPGEEGSIAWCTPFEMSELTQSASVMQSRSVSGLQRQARDLGACGLLDIQLEIRDDAWLEPSHEYLATGTAVRRLQTVTQNEQIDSPGDSALLVLSLSD